MVTNRCYNVDFATLSDDKLLFYFAKEMYFDEKTFFIRSTIEKSLKRLLKSPAIMASRISKILFNRNSE